MTNEMLAQYANYALASAALVITVAMLCYAFYLSQAVPVREQAEVEAKVPATVGGGEGDATAEGGAAPAAEPAETSARARKTAGIAGSMSWLGAFFLLVSFACRGFAVERFPLGNLFEFSVAGAFFTMATFAVAGLRRDLRWLGVFVTAFVTLLLMVASTWYLVVTSILMVGQYYLERYYARGASRELTNKQRKAQSTLTQSKGAPHGGGGQV